MPILSLSLALPPSSFFLCLCLIFKFHLLVVEDFLLRCGNPKGLEEGRLWCDNIRWCRPFRVQLRVLSFSSSCRTEGSQIFVCPCASIFENQSRNPDAFCSLAYGSYCIYILMWLIWVLIWTFLFVCQYHYKCKIFSCVNLWTGVCSFVALPDLGKLLMCKIKLYIIMRKNFQRVSQFLFHFCINFWILF